MKIALNSSTVVASLLWGSIGFGIAVFGYRQKDMRNLFGGIAIVAVSYFVWSALYMSLTAVLLIAAIIWLRRYF